MTTREVLKRAVYSRLPHRSRVLLLEGYGEVLAVVAAPAHWKQRALDPHYIRAAEKDLALASPAGVLAKVLAGSAEDIERGLDAWYRGAYDKGVRDGRFEGYRKGVEHMMLRNRARRAIATTLERITTLLGE